MRVFFIISSLGALGGTERVAVTLANALSISHDISVISRSEGVVSYKLSSNVKDLRCPGNILSFRRKVQKLIDKYQPDIVVIHTMSKLTPFLISTGLKAKKIWSYEHISFEFHSLLYKTIRKLTYYKLDKVLVLSESQNALLSKFNKNVITVRNPSPIEISTKQYNNDSKNIVSIGRLTHQKGYDMLLEAWSKIHLKNENWILNIYGDGEDKNMLINKAKALGLSSTIFQGPISNVEDIYDNASFYVMSSRFEGLPMVLIEAQSRGLPIISYDCPSGPSEIIEHGKDGYLVPTNSIVELSEYIQLLIDNPGLRSEMSIKALVSARRFKLEKVIEEWEVLLNEPN